MRFNPPSSKTVGLSVLVALFGLSISYIFPSIQGQQVFVLVAAYLILLVGTVFKGL